MYFFSFFLINRDDDIKHKNYVDRNNANGKANFIPFAYIV